MNPAVILGIIGAALALVPIVYELVLLTIDFIKKLKKKKDNKVIAMQIADVFAGIANNPSFYRGKISNLKKEGVVCAVVDENNKVAPDDITFYDDVDSAVIETISQNKGIYIV